MATADKARFYLEHSVPELHQLERKKLFSRDEVSSIAKKRSDFEYLLNSSNGRPHDWAQYVTYELNLRALQQKRAKRVGLRPGAAGLNASQKRLFFILDRATRKFHGDIGLWMLSLDFARRERANRKLEEILTKALRLHPTRPDLWQYAAAWAIDFEGDMTKARAYMQRGLRFCKKEWCIWKDYAKLEMSHLAKIAGRRKILGLDGEAAKQDRQAQQDGADEDADMIALPAITAEDINPDPDQKDDAVDEDALGNLAATPALTGAIPMAIFDAAMKQFSHHAELTEQFFDMFWEFSQVACTARILEHVVSSLRTYSPGSLQMAVCSFKQPLFGVEPLSAEFPRALKESLSRLKSAAEERPQDRSVIAQQAIKQLAPYLEIEELDPDVAKVIRSRIKQLQGMQ